MSGGGQQRMLPKGKNSLEQRSGRFKLKKLNRGNNSVGSWNPSLNR